MGNAPSDRRALLAVLIVAVVAVGLYVFLSSSGEPHGTVAKLSAWLADGGECEEVETEAVRLPVKGERRSQVALANQRFNGRASASALVSCGGLNGYISYYRFPTAKSRAVAVAGRSALREHELFCVKGPELVVNDLFGYDQTAILCRRLGFSIHKPPRPFLGARTAVPGDSRGRRVDFVLPVRA